jgi:tight adherence protein B
VDPLEALRRGRRRVSLFAGVLAALAFVSAALSAHAARRDGVLERATAASDASRSAWGRNNWPSWLGVSWVVPGPHPITFAIMAALLGFAIARIPGAAIAASLAAGAPIALRRRRRVLARTTEAEQLTDAVAAVGAGLRAGLSLAQSIRYAANETGQPLRRSLAGIGDRTTLGMPLGDSIDVWADGLGGRDARLVAGVLRLHRKSGGDLPSVLDRLAETLRQRRAAAREIRSLTAQGRMSGAILGLLPVAFFCFIALTAPHDLSVALASPVGVTSIVTGFAMQLAAFLWIRALLRVS